MATINKAALSDRVLQHIGVLTAGATAASADTTLVEEQIDVVMYQLRALGLAPFESSAIPEYAQQPLRDIVAFKVAPSFGITAQRLLEYEQAKTRAEYEMGRQTASYKQPRRVRIQRF